MPVLGLTADGKKIASRSVAGPTSYSAANGHAITISDLKRVDEVLLAMIDGGYKVANYSKSGNTVTLFYHYYNYPAASAGVSVTVPDTTDLSARTITVVVIGV